VLSKLTVQDKHKKMASAEWAQNNEVSFNNVWFSDEMHFYLDGGVNKMCNLGGQRIHVIHEKLHHVSRITVCVTISSHGLLGPSFFEETVSSER
jgi:hypothetical protein